MGCMKGFCWFMISMMLSSFATVACFGIYFHFGGPPPHEAIDVGLKVLSVWSISSIFVSFLCLIALSTRSKSTCLIFFCELGLFVSCAASFFIRMFLHEVSLDPEGMTDYTMDYLRENGRPPPFLDTIQREMNCCGINGAEDYLKAKGPNGVISLPPSCCKRMEKNSSRCMLFTLGRALSGSSAVDTENFKYNNDGCKNFLNSSTTLLTSLPPGSRPWLSVLLYVNNLKDFYLDFMVFYTLMLFLVFNYHLIRYCLRRPEVVPRAPPLEYETRSTCRPLSLIPTALDVDHNMNITKHDSTSPSPYLFPRGRVMNEFGSHPFMLSAIGVRPTIPTNRPAAVHRNVIVPVPNTAPPHPGPCERCLRFSNPPYNPTIINDPVPSAPPPPPPPPYFNINENQA